MTKLFINCAIVAMVALSACSITQNTDLSCNLAHGYFVKNYVDSVPVCITNQRDFSAVFGTAAVMGPDGMPTKIDFENQFVVAVSLPETNIETEISLQSLKCKNNEIDITYGVSQGEKMTYSIRPLMMVVVDKKYQGEKVTAHAK